MSTHRREETTVPASIQGQVRATYARRGRRYDAIPRGLTLGLEARLRRRLVDRLMILFAAGLVAQGVHGLQEAALLLTLVEHVWDINPILDERGAVGAFLKALFGYNGNPSLLEVAAYGAYFVVVGAVGLRQGRAMVAAEETSS